MAQANDAEGIVYQNLSDAGCNEETIQQCMKLVKEGKTKDILPILTEYRTALRNSIRAGQKQIDALDFLIYRVQKHDSEVTGGSNNESKV